MAPQPLARRIGWPLLGGLALVWVAAIAREWMTLARFAYQDLTHFTQGGQFVREGLSPYSAAFGDTGNHLPYIYPPIWALVFAPLSLLPTRLLEAAWTAATLVALWALVSIAIRPLLEAEDGDRRRRAVLVTVAAVLTLALGPVAETLYFGQIGIFVVLACLVDAVVLVQRPTRFRGILVGVATAIKLTPALIVVHWVITRQWRAAATAMVTTAVCWGIAAVALPAMFADYFFGGVMFGITGHVGAERVSNQSIFGLLTRLLGQAPPTVLWGALALATACVGLWLARRAHLRGDLLAAISIVGLTTLLVSPMSWQHHAVWVVPAIGALIGDGRDRRRLLGGLAALVLLYSPTQGAQIAALVGFTEYWNLLYVILIGALAWVVTRTPGSAARPGPARG